MLSSAFMLLLSGAFLTLRLGPGSGSFPRPLRPEEERAAVDAWVNTGDLDARNTLVEHNLRLVAHIVKKYYAQTADQEDLVSIGTIGLIKGVSTYRPEKNVRLATYASRCIENAMLSPKTFWNRIGAPKLRTPGKLPAGTSCFRLMRECMSWRSTITEQSDTRPFVSIVSG